MLKPRHPAADVGHPGAGLYALRPDSHAGRLMGIPAATLLSGTIHELVTGVTGDFEKNPSIIHRFIVFYNKHSPNAVNWIIYGFNPGFCERQGMPKVISANRLADGIVVYASRDGSWSERLSQANIFSSKAEAEAGLIVAQNDAKCNLVVEPVVVEVTGDASGLRAVTLREAIRARGPTIDFLPRKHAFAQAADAPQENTAKQATNAVLGIPRLADTRQQDPREHELISAADFPEEIAR